MRHQRGVAQRSTARSGHCGHPWQGSAIPPPTWCVCCFCHYQSYSWKRLVQFVARNFPFLKLQKVSFYNDIFFSHFKSKTEWLTGGIGLGRGTGHATRARATTARAG